MRICINTIAVFLASGGIAFAQAASYPSPHEAISTFATALADNDRATLLEVFGEDSAPLLLSDDPAENAENRTTMIRLFDEGFLQRTEDDGSITLLLGKEFWPFPIPLAQSDDGWAFDIEAGTAEIAARRVGRNELGVMELLDRYVMLQSEFRQTDHNGDGVMEFARHIISSADNRDGLFWPGDDSPVGALLAQANFDGFTSDGDDHPPIPYSGYYFRILDAQGPSAPGGESSYLVNGYMVGGHALLAVPADYGVTGIYSFLVGENGVIFEADFGEEGLFMAETYRAYDPDENWSVLE